MRIVVGSLNPGKIEAVKKFVQEYDCLSGADVVGVSVVSSVSSQPLTLDDTVKGAVTRARNAFRIPCDLSVGIESGLMPVPSTLSGYMDFCVCAFYDGKRPYLGISSMFEYPENITRMIVYDGLEASDAAKKAGITNHEKIGNEGGIISIISGGKLTRPEYTRQALVCAFLHVPRKK